MVIESLYTQVRELWLRIQHSWQFLIWGGVAWLILYIQIPYGFFLQDDLWLWYGVQRFAAGAVPIRDFQAYDPGRYIITYILAFGHDSLYALRFVQAVIGASIVSAGVWFIQRKKHVHIGVIVMTAIVLIAWLFPRHKYYDIAISVASVLYLWYLLKFQTHTARLLAAPMIFLSFLIGRNHALYLVLGLFLWVIWHRLSCPLEQQMKWQQYKELLYGVVIVLVIILFIFVLVPGFVETYYNYAITPFFEGQPTNLTLRITWPWQIDWFAVTTLAALRDVIFSWQLFLLPCIGLGALIWESRFTRRTGILRPYLLAPALLIIPYTYHVYSRADISHLAQSIYPLILYISAFVSQISIDTTVARYKRLVWLMFGIWIVASLFVMYPQHHITNRAGRYVPVLIESKVFFTDVATRDDYLLLQQLLEKHSASTSFVIYPMRPGLYALNHVSAPVYETYVIFASNANKQTREIMSIESNQVRMIILAKTSVDALNETAFRNTNPLIFAHIQKNYTVVDETQYYEVYLRNSVVP